MKDANSTTANPPRGSTAPLNEPIKNDFEGRTLTLKVKFANKREQSEVYFDSAEREQTRQNGKFLDFQQITRSITVDHILRTKDEILPLAKQLMQSVEFHSHH